MGRWRETALTVEDQEADVADPANLALLLLAPSDRVEFLRGREDDVSAVECSAERLGIARHLENVDTKGPEPLRPRLVLLLHERLHGCHVDSFREAGLVSEASTSVNGSSKHPGDGKLYQTCLTTGGWCRDHEVIIAIVDLRSRKKAVKRSIQCSLYIIKDRLRRRK